MQQKQLSCITKTLKVLQQRLTATNSRQSSKCTMSALPRPQPAATPTGSDGAAIQLNQCSGAQSAPGMGDCRICLSAASTQQDLIQPCSCAGSMAYAHAACLTAWVQEKGSLTCELCKTSYNQQFMQELALAAAAAACNPGHKEGTSPGAAVPADAVAEGDHSWNLPRRWRLWFT